MALITLYLRVGRRRQLLLPISYHRASKGSNHLPPHFFLPPSDGVQSWFQIEMTKLVLYAMHTHLGEVFGATAVSLPGVLVFLCPVALRACAALLRMA